MKPGAPAFPRLRAAARGLVEVLLPTREFDGAAAAQSRGLNPEAWRKIDFIDAPACEGCGAFPLSFREECRGG